MCSAPAHFRKQVGTTSPPGRLNALWNCPCWSRSHRAGRRNERRGRPCGVEEQQWAPPQPASARTVEPVGSGDPNSSGTPHRRADLAPRSLALTDAQLIRPSKTTDRSVTPPLLTRLDPAPPRAHPHRNRTRPHHRLAPRTRLGSNHPPHHWPGHLATEHQQHPVSPVIQNPSAAPDRSSLRSCQARLVATCPREQGCQLEHR